MVYLLAAYFIAMNRYTNISPEENITILESGLRESFLFRMMCGNEKTYFSDKKLAMRKQWEQESHERKYENDWVIQFIPGKGGYVFGLDYTECGVCKLCRDENCFELAKYLCRLDFMQVDIMGITLHRTQKLAENGKLCDFRFGRKEH